MKMIKRIPLMVLFFPIFLVAQNWETSYNNALIKSKEENKPIILVFAGSDWCAPCILLDNQIWQSEEFKDFSKENYVLYKADFPRKKANKLKMDLALQNGELAKRYNPKGYFPLVVVLNQDESILGTTGYKRKEPKAYIRLLNSFIE